MCIYVTVPLSESAAMLVIPKPAGTTIPHGTTAIVKTGSATFFDEAYGGGNGVNYESYKANQIHNLQYAQNGPHPTEMVVAYDSGVAVYMDQVIVIATSLTAAAASNYAKVPETGPHLKEYVKRGVAGDGGGRIFGYGTCMWLRKCDQTGEIMGSSCSATLSNVVYNGFCFTSDTGSLECGRLSASDDVHGEAPRSFDVAISPNVLPSTAGAVDIEDHGAPTTTFVASTPGASGTAYRCPTGSPAKSLGAFVSKRLLSAGCMISGDANFDSLAEIHVPAYCATPADYLKGCMLPSASNFDPNAKQPSTYCLFPTIGCTNPTALNYNTLATISATNCVLPVLGCTISGSYAGDESATPSYKSGFYGSALQGSGGWAYRKVNQSAVYTGAAIWDPPAVTNYLSTANVNSGCVVAVEGCMDSSARNYDSKATINSNTWCVPVVLGCMVPDEAHAGPGYNNPQTISTSPVIPSKPDEPTSTYAATTTLNVPSMCFAARFGCNETDSVNYDPLVTVKTICYKTVFGCLNPNAVNFGCPDTTYAAPCTFAEADRVTVHYSFLCRWNNLSPPPSPPPSPAPPAGDFDTQLTVDLEMQVDATPTELAAKEQAMKDVFKAMLGPSYTGEISFTAVTIASRRRLSIGTGSSDVTLTAPVADAAEATSLQNLVSSAVGTSPQSATAAFASTGLQVISTPVVEQGTVYLEKSNPASAAARAAMIAGIVGGVVGALLLAIIGAVVYFRRKKKSAVHAA